MARRPRFSRGEARRDALIEAPRRAARLVGRGVEGEAHLEVGHVRAEEAHGALAHGSGRRGAGWGCGPAPGGIKTELKQGCSGLQPIAGGRLPCARRARTATGRRDRQPIRPTAGPGAVRPACQAAALSFGLVSPRTQGCGRLLASLIKGTGRGRSPRRTAVQRQKSRSSSGRADPAAVRG